MRFPRAQSFPRGRTLDTCVGPIGLALAVALAVGPVPVHAQPTDPNVGANFTFTNNWMSGLARATDIAFLADGRAVVTLRGGTVVVRRANATLNNNAFTFPNTDSTSEKGLLGVTALRSWRERPDGSEAQRTLFFFVSNGPSNSDKHRVYRGVLQADDTLQVDLNNPIVSMGLEGPANHDGGTVQAHGGHLYVSTGDTGANARDPQNKYGSCLNKALGKILRVNLDGSIPADNPLAGVAQVTSCQTPTGAWGMAPPDRRVFAWGFRNPFRIWVDPMTGLVWAGDVGEEMREEIAVVRKGEHHGFPFREGTRVNPRNLGAVNDCADVTPTGPCVAPVYEYNRGENDNRAVIGGLIPNEDGRLCGWPDAYKDRYFFGDYNGGRIWSMQVNRTQGTVVAGSVREFARPGNVVSFKVGFDDALYVVRHQDAGGTVMRIAPSARDAAACGNNAMNMGGAGGSSMMNTGGSSATGGSGGGAMMNTGGAGGGSGGGGGAMMNTGGDPMSTGGTTGSGGADAGGAAGGAEGPGGVGGEPAGMAGAGMPGDGDGTSGDAGCSCNLGGRPRAPVAWLALLGGLFLARRRRRRAR